MPRPKYAVFPGLAAALVGLLLATSAYAQDDEEMSFGALEVDQKAIPAAELMDSGVQKFDAKDYAGASLDLFTVVEAGDAPEAVKFSAKAEYMLGRSLYQLGFYQAALAYFDRIIETGSEHRYHRATHKQLFLIFRKLGDPTIIEKLAGYDRSVFDERIRDDLLFVIGKHHYDQGNLDEALSYLQDIPRSSKHYAKAQFLAGVLYVRKNEAKPAVEAFKEILRVVADDPGSVKDPDKYERLAFLSLARIFYSTRQYELALKYYDKVPVESAEWLEALLESAWAFFQMDNFEKALGNLHTLESPYFADQYFPESHVLRSVVYFTTCNYEDVRKTIDRFMASFEPLKEQAQGYLEQYQEPSEFWSFLLSLNREGGDFDARTQQIFNAAFSDRALGRMLRYIRKVEAELDAVKQAKGAWGESPLAAQLIQDVEVVRSLAIHRAGELAQARFSRVLGELAELISQMRKVKFETANAEMGQIENKMRDEQYSGKEALRQAELKKTDEEHVYWPFEQEYWKDELGSYVATVRVRCGR